MKMMQKFVKSLIAGGVTLAMISTLTAQVPVDTVAKVVRVKGPARYTLGNNVWQPLEPGAILKPGTLVQTGKDPGCYVDLVFGDAKAPTAAAGPSFTPTIPSSYVSYNLQAGTAQNVVRIFQNSALGIDKLTKMETGAGTVTETQLDLRAGKIAGVVKKMTPASRYEIKIPNGVAGIRGTTFVLSADGTFSVTDSDNISVISIVHTDGTITTQNVGAGQTYDPAGGGLSNLTPMQRDQINKLLQGMGYVAATAYGGVGNDRTMYIPISDHGNGQGQDNNNQGQNNNNQGQNGNNQDRSIRR